MKEYDYAAVLEAMLTLEGTTFSQYTDAAYQYERVLHKHFDTIRHALRFAEKMMHEPSREMEAAFYVCHDEAGTDGWGRPIDPTSAEIFKAMRDAALKELGE